MPHYAQLFWLNPIKNSVSLYLCRLCFILTTLYIFQGSFILLLTLIWKNQACNFIPSSFWLNEVLSLECQAFAERCERLAHVMSIRIDKVKISILSNWVCKRPCQRHQSFCEVIFSKSCCKQSVALFHQTADLTFSANRMITGNLNF